MRAAAAGLAAALLIGCATPGLEDGTFTVSILNPRGIQGTVSYLSGSAAVRPNEFGCVAIVLEDDLGSTLEIADACPLQESGFPNGGSFVLNELTRNPHSVDLDIGQDRYTSVGGTLDLEDVGRRHARGRFGATVVRVVALEPDSVALSDTLTILGSFNAAATP